MAYGYRMSTSEQEQYRLWLLFADAMAHRYPVEVSFFKSKKITHTRTVHGVKQEITYNGYVKVTRTIEPHGFAVSKAGARLVHCVDRSPEGTWGPEYRAVRLDRIAVNSRTDKPVVRRRTSHGYICPSLLDNRPLHKTKAELTGAAA